MLIPVGDSRILHSVTAPLAMELSGGDHDIYPPLVEICWY